MEKVHTFSMLTPFARTYWLIGGFLVLASFLLLFVRLNAESYTSGKYHADEYHTIHEGLNLLVNGRVDNFRAQESVRWLVRAFYPYALVYVNTHMGGNVHIDGWSYPGHNYIAKNFVNQSSPPEVFSSDPNLRNLFHALRQLYIFFVFACLLALLLFFLREKYYAVAFGGIFLLGFNLDLLGEQKIFYLEPAMLASIALILLAYCYFLYHGRMSGGVPILFGFLGAFLVATKFSTVLFVILPVILFFYVLNYRDALKHIGIYVASLAIFYALINFPAFVSLESFNMFLHDLSSNFWQYSAGSDSTSTIAPGIPHFSMIIYQLEGLLGYALYVMPVITVFAVYYSNAKERMILLPLVVLELFSIYSLSGQHVYLPRNMVPFYLPVVITSLLSVEIVIRKLACTYSRKRLWVGVAVVLLLWFVGIVVHAGGITSFKSGLFPDSKAGFIAELRIHDQSGPEGVWYSIGFPDRFFEGEGFGKRIVAKDNAPLILDNTNYPDLTSQFSSLPKGSIVIVNNVANNKHLTNYILPKYFNGNLQFGRYYVFFDVR